MGKPTIFAWLFALFLMLSSGGSESAVTGWLTATAFAIAILLSILFLFKSPGVVLVSLAALGLGSYGQGAEKIPLSNSLEAIEYRVIPVNQGSNHG